MDVNHRTKTKNTTMKRSIFSLASPVPEQKSVPSRQQTAARPRMVSGEDDGARRCRRRHFVDASGKKGKKKTSMFSFFCLSFPLLFFPPQSSAFLFYFDSKVYRSIHCTSTGNGKKGAAEEYGSSSFFFCLSLPFFSFLFPVLVMVFVERSENHFFRERAGERRRRNKTIS